MAVRVGICRIAPGDPGRSETNERPRTTLHTLACAVALLLVACAPVRQLRPLAPGESSLSLGVGGPLTEVKSLKLPLPLVSLGYNRGLVDDLDVEAGLQLTNLVFGVAGVDAGVNWRPLAPKGWRPGLILTPRLNLFADLSPLDASTLRLYPDAAATLLWRWQGLGYTYTGVQCWLELSDTRVDGLPQEHRFLPAWYLGQAFDYGRWQYQIEARLYLPATKNTGRGPRNLGFGDYGMLGILLGVSHSFGGSP